MNYSKKSTSRKQKALKGKGTKMGKKLGVVFMKTLLVLIIALGVAGLCGGIGIIKGVMENAPDITSASVLPRGYKSVVYDADGNKTAELVAEGTNRTYVKLDNIPKHVQEAFIAIEDERFYEHNGIDIQGMVRAGVKFVVSGFRTTQGASTITQQLLKNNVFDFMSEDGMLDKIERKLQEQYLAIQLEKVMSKTEILESYLNTINLGQNCLGVQAAANRYFGKSVSELDISEAAVIAAITKSPSGYNPIKHPDKNKERRALVLKNMMDQGYISESEYEDALADDVYARIQENNETTETTNTVYSYFVDELIDQVKADLVEKARMYKNCAISVSGEVAPEARVAIAQAANDLLTIQGVDASFVAVQVGTGVNISARSLGAVNVQVIMESLGGGGHQTMAAAQLKHITPEAARARIEGAIDKYYASQKKGDVEGK